jgi:hypothetical protein
MFWKRKKLSLTTAEVLSEIVKDICIPQQKAYLNAADNTAPPLLFAMMWATSYVVFDIKTIWDREEGRLLAKNAVAGSFVLHGFAPLFRTVTKKEVAKAHELFDDCIPSAHRLWMEFSRNTDDAKAMELWGKSDSFGAKSILGVDAYSSQLAFLALLATAQASVIFIRDHYYDAPLSNGNS